VGQSGRVHSLVIQFARLYIDYPLGVKEPFTRSDVQFLSGWEFVGSEFDLSFHFSFLLTERCRSADRRLARSAAPESPLQQRMGLSRITI
jgi:hypothetical protein